MLNIIEGPLVSVLTPTWNRAVYLERVWKGLCSQTYKNFEWIVSNDGSTDDTESVVRLLAAKSDFPVILISANVHVGKARMDNEAVGLASGEFILWNDSDDYLLPHGIENLVECWNSIPASDRGNFVGVTAFCATQDGSILTPLLEQVPRDTTWNDLSQKHKVTGDMMNFTKASALKSCPFPEVDLVIPEGVTWTTLGSANVRVRPDVVMIKEYRAVNAISFSGKQEYCRGRAYAMATSERNLRSYPRPLKVRLWKLITFIRYSLHGELSYQDQVSLWGENSPRFLWALMCLPACLLALKDRLQGKVRRTHREFMAASRIVIITSQRLEITGDKTTNAAGKANC